MGEFAPNEISSLFKEDNFPSGEQVNRPHEVQANGFEFSYDPLGRRHIVNSVEDEQLVIRWHTENTVVVNYLGVRREAGIGFPARNSADSTVIGYSGDVIFINDHKQEGEVALIRMLKRILHLQNTEDILGQARDRAINTSGRS